jgi:hypothetical protein
MATLRSGEGVPCGFRATGNPGGPGHGVVATVVPASIGARRAFGAYVEVRGALRSRLDQGAGRRDLSLMRPEVGTDRRSLARTTTIELQHELVVRLRSEAASRQMSVVRLVHDLLDVIVTDKLTPRFLTIPARGKRRGGQPLLGQIAHLGLQHKQRRKCYLRRYLTRFALLELQR